MADASTERLPAVVRVSELQRVAPERILVVARERGRLTLGEDGAAVAA